MLRILSGLRSDPITVPNISNLFSAHIILVVCDVDRHHSESIDDTARLAKQDVPVSNAELVDIYLPGRLIC